MVAVLNGADDAFAHHAPEFRRAGGTAVQVGASRDPLAACDSPLFDGPARVTIRPTIAMTREIRVDDPLLDALRGALPTEQALVELIATIAAYNMVSRFLVATGVTPE